jgi:hypothetical protein
MTIGWQEQLKAGGALKGIVQQATAALVAMDAERLHELARCCADLNREPEFTHEVALAPNDAKVELELFKRVLYEARANLTVLSRLHAIRLRETHLLQDRHGASRSDGEADSFGFWCDRERVPEYGDN